LDENLERGLRLHIETEYTSLYTWAITEVDARGQVLGEAQIPWNWSLGFTATSCVLRDHTKTELGASEAGHQQYITATLRPGWPDERDDLNRTPRFSMFGTERAIKNISLQIHPGSDPDQQEYCMTSGFVSYTAENDFGVDETADDYLNFQLILKPVTFSRLAAQVLDRSVDEMILSVDQVAGFYAPWSPTIYTPSVKVLTSTDAHDITLPPGFKIELPRLAEVGKAELIINRRLVLDKTVPTLAASAQIEENETERAAPKTHSARPAGNVPMLQALRSLNRAVGFGVILLALILIATLLKH
jgi:hypothetical protein